MEIAARLYVVLASLNRGSRMSHMAPSEILSVEKSRFHALLASFDGFIGHLRSYWCNKSSFMAEFVIILMISDDFRFVPIIEV